MYTSPNASLLETVSHRTEFLPISFHHTKVIPGAEQVLYLHWHNEVEFLLIKQGGATFYIEDQEYTLRTGDAIFVPPNLLHMAKSLDENACEFYAIVFSHNYLFDTSFNPHYVKYVSPVMNYSLRCPLLLTPAVSWHKDIIETLIKMYELSQYCVDLWELQMQGMLLIIWQSIYNNHLSKIEASNKLSKRSIQLENAMNYIHNSYNEDITLRKLAAMTCLSEGQFCRLFKLLTGVTPFSYINRYKVIKSCEYLENTQKKIAEIASLCGFNNISYYNREFMKYIKMTPSSYRYMVMDFGGK